MDLNKCTKKQLISKVQGQQGVINLQFSLIKDQKISINSLIKLGKHMLWHFNRMNKSWLVTYYVGAILGMILGLFLGGIL